jgi:hypothetical protein
MKIVQHHSTHSKDNTKPFFFVTLANDEGFTVEVEAFGDPETSTLKKAAAEVGAVSYIFFNFMVFFQIVKHEMCEAIQKSNYNKTIARYALKFVSNSKIEKLSGAAVLTIDNFGDGTKVSKFLIAILVQFFFSI